MPDYDARQMTQMHRFDHGTAHADFAHWSEIGATRKHRSVPRHMQVEDIGQGHFGIAKKMIYRPSGEEVAVKFIERGEQVRICQPVLCGQCAKILVGAR